MLHFVCMCGNDEELPKGFPFLATRPGYRHLEERMNRAETPERALSTPEQPAPMYTQFSPSGRACNFPERVPAGGLKWRRCHCANGTFSPRESRLALSAPSNHSGMQSSGSLPLSPGPLSVPSSALFSNAHSSLGNSEPALTRVHTIQKRE